MWCGILRRKLTGVLADPTFKPVCTWTESQLTISPENSTAKASAKSVLPAPVGPTMAIRRRIRYVAGQTSRNRDAVTASLFQSYIGSSGTVYVAVMPL